jgi:hypothetical protein
VAALKDAWNEEVEGVVRRVSGVGVGDGWGGVQEGVRAVEGRVRGVVEGEGAGRGNGSGSGDGDGDGMGERPLRLLEMKS